MQINKSGPDYSGHRVNQAHFSNEIVSLEKAIIIWIVLCDIMKPALSYNIMF
jgi:hypothetical protein